MALEAQTCRYCWGAGQGRDEREGNWKWLLHINSVIIQRGVLSQKLSRPCLPLVQDYARECLHPSGENLSAEEPFGRRSTNTRRFRPMSGGEPTGTRGIGGEGQVFA